LRRGTITFSVPASNAGHSTPPLPPDRRKNASAQPGQGGCGNDRKIFSPQNANDAGRLRRRISLLRATRQGAWGDKSINHAYYKNREEQNKYFIVFIAIIFLLF
jgi:hypothetical protein